MNNCVEKIDSGLSTLIFEANKAVGWWDNPRPDGSTIALIHSEISEAYEGLLLGSDDQHLPQYKNFVVELADTAIRIYDFAGFKGWDVKTAAQAFFASGELNEDAICSSLCHLHLLVSKALEGIRKDLHRDVTYMNVTFTVHEALYYLSGALLLIYNLADQLTNEDFEQVISDKLKFNSERADHKRDNRAKAGGKKF